MKLQVWTGHSNLRQLNLRDRHTVAPDEPDLVFHSAVDVTQASFTVGRSTRSDVVLDDAYVSRYALRFSKQGDEWWVEYLNRHKVEHRRWAQQHQPPKCDGRECLAVGEHAFLINGGANRDRSFIILVSIDESGPNGSRVNATDPVPMPTPEATTLVTPSYQVSSHGLGENLALFCEAYRSFLRWPPLRRPEVVKDPIVKKKTGTDPAHAVVTVIKYAIS